MAKDKNPSFVGFFVIILILLFAIQDCVCSGDKGGSKEGICKLSGCNRSADGWQHGSGESSGVYGCARTQMAVESGWGYCSKSHCAKD